MQRYNIDIDSLIYPLFVREGSRVREPVISMPGINRYPLNGLRTEVKALYGLGIKKLLLFGISNRKDEYASAAYKEGAIVADAVKMIKDNFSDIVLFTDVCLCAYTSHGHCAILKAKDNPLIDKKATLELLSEMALRHAAVGADYVAPSAMARHQVKAIRAKLDANGYEDTKIMGYSAKFASNFYWPFRDAAGSAPSFGSRSSYQLGYKDLDKALSEIADDIKEGADIVMVKPALAYLDIIYRIREEFDLPVAAYNVSGEYAMIKAADKMGWLDGSKVMIETLMAIKRAGADLILTYFAVDAAKALTRS